MSCHSCFNTNDVAKIRTYFELTKRKANYFAILFYYLVSGYLLIHSAAMGTMAFAAEGLAAMTAEVAVVGMAAVAPNGKGYVGYEQRIADVIKGENAEYYIVNSTDSDQTCQIKHGIKG